MFFAIREIRHAKLRFALIGVVVALTAALVFILTGLGTGLADANVSGMRKLPSEVIVLQSDVKRYLHRSNLPVGTADLDRDVPGVAWAEPIGHLTAAVRKDGGGVAADEPTDVTVFGVPDDARWLPDGLRLAGADRAVIDQHLADKGVRVGDTLTVEPSHRKVVVQAVVSGFTFNHLPMVFVPLRTWQEVKFGPVDGRGAVPDSAYDTISAVVVGPSPGVDEATLVRRLARVPGTEPLTVEDAIQSIPGYKEEGGTVDLMKGFLFLIGGLVIGVFFWIITLAKVGDVAVLRATGASGRLLATNLLAQVGIIAVAGLVVGAAVSFAMSAALPANAPFSLHAADVLTAAAILAALAVAAGGASLWRLLRVDPLLAIGRAS